MENLQLASYENRQVALQPVEQIILAVEKAVSLKGLITKVLATNEVSKMQLQAIQETRLDSTSAPFEELEAYRQLVLGLVNNGTIQTKF